MKNEKGSTSQEHRILECIDQETNLVNYYNNLMNHIGPDCEPLVKTLLEDHQKHVQLLQNLLDGLEELRELTGAISD